jgi:hypothetical protein
VERWVRDDGARLVHAVNYGDAPVRVLLPDEWAGVRLHSPDVATTIEDGNGSHLVLDLYAVLELPD